MRVGDLHDVAGEWCVQQVAECGAVHGHNGPAFVNDLDLLGERQVVEVNVLEPVGIERVEHLVLVSRRRRPARFREIKTRR